MTRFTKCIDPKAPDPVYDWSEEAKELCKKNPIPVGSTCRKILGTAEDLGFDATTLHHKLAQLPSPKNTILAPGKISYSFSLDCVPYTTVNGADLSVEDLTKEVLDIPGVLNFTFDFICWFELEYENHAQTTKKVEAVLKRYGVGCVDE